MPDYQEELYGLYRLLSREDGHALAWQRIALMVDPLSNSLSEKIARIKQKFVKTLGPELARYYYIQGPKAGKKRILLDRALVQFDERQPLLCICSEYMKQGIAALCLAFPGSFQLPLSDFQNQERPKSNNFIP